MSFKITVTAACKQDTISLVTQVADIEYLVQDPATESKVKPDFAQQIDSCPHTFSITVDGEPLADQTGPV